MSLITSREEIEQKFTTRKCVECQLDATIALCRDDDEFTEVGHGPNCSYSLDQHLKHNLQRLGDDPWALMRVPRIPHQGNYDPIRERALQAHQGEPKFPPKTDCNLCRGMGIRQDEEDACYCMCRYVKKLPEWALRTT